MKVFLTGAAGFIGFHTAHSLLRDGHEVHGYDSVNSYYDPFFKTIRLEVLSKFSNFSFTQGLLEDNAGLVETYKAFAPSHVVHLAAQAGVRYSLENPQAYIQSNIVGFQNIIELNRHNPNLVNFVYASSSSVYGSNKKSPFSESDECSHPISLYAASKLSNELVAAAYGHLFKVPCTGLRFFTVYGPYGRPDMALFSFTEKILRDEEIPVFNFGNMVRDFTYIDDIVKGVRASLDKPQIAQIYNLGGGRQERLMDMIELLEAALGKKAKKNLLPLQAGDVESTASDLSKPKQDLGYQPTVRLGQGIPKFVEWYMQVRKQRSSTTGIL